MDFETKVKETLIHAGFRHKNAIVSVRSTGNGVDTTRRAAWFAYEVTWKKPPSPALLHHLKNLTPLMPDIQAYASDVDRINLVVASAGATNDE
ncbi:hypothetical protein [Paraburkholderia sp. SIMBA_054]|uniref:hypothetical protein n=1 Tax=Paraburkholderia sp. SIMBA_054 TaxID=3085795 RepID=UPI00397CD724